MDKWKLINYVKMNPVLYDIAHPLYEDIKAKQKLWYKIAAETGAKVGKVRSTWNYLKWSYVRVLQRKMLGDTLAKKWIFEDEMEFLYPSVEGKIQTGDNGSDFELDLNGSASDSEDQYILDDSESEEDTEFDGEILIQAVKNSPILYNEENKDNKSKLEAWKNVAEETKESVRKCQRRWKTLQAQYIKILKKCEENQSKRLRWKYFKEMEFIKPFLNAFLNKQTKFPTSTMEFFVSMANIVKKLPHSEQEALETLIIDMITETEIEYQKELSCKSKNSAEDCPNKPNSSRDVRSNEDEFVQRVKFEAQDCETSVVSSIKDDPLNTCFGNNMQNIDPSITPTEQYVIKVIPEPESSEVQEEYIINVLPDSTDINAPAIKAEVEEEIDVKKEFQFKKEPEEQNSLQ